MGDKEVAVFIKEKVNESGGSTLSLAVPENISEIQVI